MITHIDYEKLKNGWLKILNKGVDNFMDEFWTDQIANIIASALLANGNEVDNNILRDEHNKVLEKLSKS